MKLRIKQPTSLQWSEDYNSRTHWLKHVKIWLRSGYIPVTFVVPTLKNQAFYRQYFGICLATIVASLQVAQKVQSSTPTRQSICRFDQTFRPPQLAYLWHILTELCPLVSHFGGTVVVPQARFCQDIYKNVKVGEKVMIFFLDLCAFRHNKSQKENQS